MIAISRHLILKKYMRENGVDRLRLKDAMDGGSVGRSKITIVNGKIAGLNTGAHSAIFGDMGQAPVGRRDLRRVVPAGQILRGVNEGDPQKVRRCLQILGLDPTENKSGWQYQREYHLLGEIL